MFEKSPKNIPDEFSEKHNNLLWREMINMRNKVIHEYFGVDVNILWQTVKEDLLELKTKTKKLLEKQP